MFEKNRAVQLLIDPSDGSILDANEAACDYYGYSREQLKQMKISQINTLAPDEVAAEMANAVTEQRNYFNFRHALASGEVRDVEVHSSPIGVDGKQVLYSIVHDITERRHAEEEVIRLNADLERRVTERTAQLEEVNRELEREIGAREVLEEIVLKQNQALRTEYERLAMVIAGVDISLSVLDRDGRIVLVNDAWLKRTGLTREQVVGVLYGAIERQPGGVEIQWLIDQVVETGVPYYERELRIPDERYTGGSLYTDASILPIRDDAGNITGLMTVSIDVTEKVLARREIEAQRTLLANIIERSPVAIAYYDRDLKVVSANSAWEKISGLDRQTAVGQVMYDISEAARQRRELYERALAGEEIKREAVPGVGKEAHFYDITYLPVRGADERVDGILAIAVDVTEREELDRQKDQFIALASHELKSPITVIKGYSQVSAKAAQRLGDPQMAQRLQTIDEQAARLTAMVDDLLDVSRMRGGTLTLEYGPFDLREVVRDSVRAVEPGAPGFKFEVTMPGPAVYVNADRARVEQVMSNLLQNAVKYSGKSRRVEIKVEVDKEMAVTSVRDFGLGIPASQQSQIFGRFFRASNVRKEHSGFGLGLFIAHSIVTQHGGRISLESVEGKGSKFTFSLPLEQV
jgi:PAS domain S-box-containing protein